MRVTNNTVINRAVRNIHTAHSRYVQKHEQVGSGKAINRLSDDPHNAAKAVRLRSTLRSIEQYRRNADTAQTSVNMYDDNLDKVGNILNRIRELTGRAATSSVTPAEREAIAVEVGELFDEIVQSANATHLGTYMYAGHKGTGTPPFAVNGDPPTGVVFKGDSGKTPVEVGPGLTVAVNVTGDEVFQKAGGVDIFDTVLKVNEHLMSSNVDALSGSDLALIDSAIDQVLKVRSEMGGRANRIELILNRLDTDEISMKGLLSKTEDVDMVQAIMDLSVQEVVYNAALAAAAKSVQAGLLDYLR